MHCVQIGLFSCLRIDLPPFPKRYRFFKLSALANTSMSHASKQLDYAKEKRNVSYVPVPFHAHSSITHPWP
jgi:hypothetical protein